MKFLHKFIIICIFFFTISCGKKSNLDRYPESDFPRDYPRHNE